MANENKGSSDVEMTFFEHLEDLRPHLMRAIGALFVISIAAFIFKGFIIDTLLFAPQTPDFPTNRWLCNMGYALNDMMGWLGGVFGTEWSMDPTVLCINSKKVAEIINLKLTGQFNLHIKVAMATGFALGIPYLLWEIWQFIKPALMPGERRGTRLFVLWVSLCFFTGALFGYFVITPLSLHFFLNYSVSEQVTNTIDISSYFSQVIGIPLGTGLIFQLPLLIYFLTRIGIVSPAFLRKYRRHALVLLAVMAAVITPPDIFSMILVMMPLYGLYEFSIFLSARTQKRYHPEEPENGGGEEAVVRTDIGATPTIEN
ncbi:MAG: twin-arginine translocase subunit TatC [Alistipes sp.]|jgi:sec-independent protein translocase protein TatC|nr:twin-arginine translocase subunit TatC [Alistipes sp.]